MKSGKSLAFWDPRNSLMLQVLNLCGATEKGKKKATSAEYISGQ